MKSICTCVRRVCLTHLFLTKTIEKTLNKKKYRKLRKIYFLDSFEYSNKDFSIEIMEYYGKNHRHWQWLKPRKFISRINFETTNETLAKQIQTCCGNGLGSMYSLSCWLLLLSIWSVVIGGNISILVEFYAFSIGAAYVHTLLSFLTTYRIANLSRRSLLFWSLETPKSDPICMLLFLHYYYYCLFF